MSIFSPWVIEVGILFPSFRNRLSTFSCSYNNESRASLEFRFPLLRTIFNLCNTEHAQPVYTSGPTCAPAQKRHQILVAPETAPRTTPALSEKTPLMGPKLSAIRAAGSHITRIWRKHLGRGGEGGEKFMYFFHLSFLVSNPLTRGWRC